jgi:hypothetical protein
MGHTELRTVGCIDGRTVTKDIDELEDETS